MARGEDLFPVNRVPERNAEIEFERNRERWTNVERWMGFGRESGIAAV